MIAVLVGVLFLACGAAALWPEPSARRRLSAPAAVGRRRVDWPAVASLVLRRPKRVLLAVAFTGALAGSLSGGPVAGFVVAVYGLLGGRAAIRWMTRRRDRAARARALDELCGLAADLRAGLPPAAVDQPLRPASVSAPAVHAELRMASLVSSVFRLAETTGAPAAELVERIEADGRAADRSRAAASAEAAGAQVTALLLAGLPLAGIGLGYLLGADSAHVLFRTPLGAACAVGAVTLQGAGLLWADRLALTAVR